MRRRRSPRPFDVALAARLHDPPRALAPALPRPIALLVPSFVADRAAAARLLAGSRALDAAMYGEWAALLLGLGEEVGYLECRGLEWETPDRHRRAVRRASLAVWRRRHET